MQGRKRRTKLTAIQVANIKPDPTKRLEIPDPAQPGLYLVVQPNGRRSWALRYRRLSDRKPRKLTLGFPSLAVAHRLAREALDQVVNGRDPAGERRAQKHIVRPPELDDIGEAFKVFLLRHTRARRGGRPIRESTKRETARILGFKRDPNDPSNWIETGVGVLAKWKGRAVSTIRPADVRDLLDDQSKRGPVSANRLLATLKLFFSWLIRRDPDALQRSPCDAIDPPSPEASRERVLNDAELGALWRAAAAQSYPFGPMIKLLLLTGCRRSEVRAACWRELDLKSGTWTIPALRSKNGLPNVVPITDAMAEILNRLPRIGSGVVLFTKDGAKAVSSLSKTKRRLDQAIAKELGNTPERWVVHDVRRTVRTRLSQLRIPREVAEAVLGHAPPGIVGTYDMYQFIEEKRAALDRWAREIDRIVKGNKLAKVVPLNRARAHE